MPVKLTKIMATLGPATGKRGKIKALVKDGVNVFRLNLSHGDHHVLHQWINWIRLAEKELNTFVGILLDLQGPKIRVGKFEKGFIHIHRGDRIILTTQNILGNEKRVPVQYKNFHRDVKKGGQVFLDDGNLCVEVRKISGQDVEVEVKVGGCLSNFKGINMPDAAISAKPLTPKDKEDLAFGLKEGVDLVALSFVGSANDIHQLRKLIKKAGSEAEIIAKIERKNAVQNLKEIVEAADGVMVARGDLGIEIPLTQVPVVQQKILRECAMQCKPAIVATQMMESMIENHRPTRAEISDVSTAVMGGADAIMLSAETAVGQHPHAAVKFMAETVRKMEGFQQQHQRVLPWRWFFGDTPPVSPAMGYSSNRMVELLGAQALLVFTRSGGRAKMVSGPHPMVPIFAFTSKMGTARKLTLLRGAVPFYVKEERTFMGDLNEIFAILKKRRLVKKGDRVVIATGVPLGVPNWTNVMRVEEVK